MVIRHQERFIDDDLWSMQTSYYPMTFVEQGASKLLAVKDITEGTRSYLEEAIGVKEIGSHDTMTVRAPSPDEAETFRPSPDGRIAVFETRPIGVDARWHARTCDDHDLPLRPQHVLDEDRGPWRSVSGLRQTGNTRSAAFAD